MLDSGSVPFSFIDREYADGLDRNVYSRHSERIEVSLARNDKTASCKEYIFVTMTLQCTQYGLIDRKIGVKLFLFEDLNVDIVIGRCDMGKFGLAKVLEKQLEAMDEHEANAYEAIFNAILTENEDMEGIGPLTEVFNLSTENYTDHWNDATLGNSPDMVDKLKN